jgi:hypothetical protein
MLPIVPSRRAVMLAALLFPSMSTAQIAVAQGAAPLMRCVPFASQERLTNGTSFRAPITPGLEIVLMSDPDGWIIQVEPAAEPGTDYLWIVSPPWQAAAHRYLGEGFGLTARQSLAMKRTLRFVTTRGAYQEAMAAYTAAGRGPVEGIVERLAQLGQGSLSFEITGFDIAHASDGFGTETINWIEFRGEGCVPAAGAGRLNDTTSSRSATSSVGLATPGGRPAIHASATASAVSDTPAALDAAIEHRDHRQRQERHACALGGQK